MGIPVSRIDCRDVAQARGFTRTDLLALLGVGAVLMLIQFTALAYTRGNSNRATCASNLRRLTLSWLMYADDNRDRLAPNLNGGNPLSLTNNWVGGILDFSSSSANTNLAMITQARLYPYNKATEIYRCPDDLSVSRGQLRIRSYSMNGWVGDGVTAWISGYQVATNRSQIRQPDHMFVFMEEHPESINDGLVIVDPSPSGQIVDYPASYHQFGAHFGFADGSVQYQAWVDPRTSPPHITLGGPSPNNPDMLWMKSNATYRK